MAAADDPALLELKEALDAGNLVLVVGRGVSEAAGLPSRRRLVELLTEHARGCGVGAADLQEVEEIASRRQLIDALSALEDQLGPNEFGAATERYLDDPDHHLPEIVQAIGALAPRLRAILTTNVDTLIERATGGNLPVVARATEDIAQRPRILLKLRGTLLERSTWGLTRKQLDGDAGAAFEAFFRSFTLLFVGYALEDEDLDQLLAGVSALAGAQAPRHFALMVAEPGKRYQRRRLANAGVRVLEYENSDGEHGEAAGILRTLATTPEPPRDAARAADGEIEIERLWPDAIRIKAPPPLDAHHVHRPDIIERITGATGKAIEVVGISGSGKTRLAAEVIERLRSVTPDRAALYAEVRSEVRLRSVLVGIAFHLHRLGFDDPLGLALRRDVAEEQVIRDVARSLGTVDRPLLLLLDLVDGTCSAGFARHLAVFVRALASARIRVAIFGQERALRDLTVLERDEHGIEHLDVRGFHFEEFASLVKHFHPAADRGALSEIYHRVTGGRSAFLFAALAESLARAESLAKMAEIAAMPPDSILSNAEQQRFGRVTAGARSAAEKLVCFVLPFRQKDAEEIFPDDNVALAVRELHTLGLLRQHDEERFEMHETVRAGLESLLAKGPRRRAHEALAAWCGRQGLIAAEILHLDWAGREEDAHRRAREVFLEGKHWDALADYVVKHRLLSAKEISDLLTQSEPSGDVYLLPDILQKLGDATAADELLRQVREQAVRFDKDFAWAWRMVEAILHCDGAKLYELILFALERPGKIGGSHARLKSLRTGARRTEVRIDERLLALFQQQTQDVQRQMVPILLLDRRREVLAPAFQLLESYEEPADRRRRGEVVSSDISLRLEQPADVVEFLAALPLVKPPARMMIARSALLGTFAGFVWSQRRLLRAQCIQILKTGAEDSTVLQNAIRVLVSLAEPTVFELCQPLLARKDKLGAFAKLVPTIAPVFVDAKTYEARFLDTSGAMEERLGDLVVLGAIGADLGRLLSRLNELDRKQAETFRIMALLQSTMYPFPEAIPLLDEILSKTNGQDAQLFIPQLMRLGELPTTEATDMLLRALSHSEARARTAAALTLGHRRSRRALSTLIKRCAEETDPDIAHLMAVSAIASGPRSSLNFLPLWPKLPNGELWQCILAERLRDASAAEQIVAIATDPSKHWSARRAAILASGRIPYEVALERIAPVVLQERSPFSIDQNHSLLAHSVVALLTLESTTEMYSDFVVGKAHFINVFGGAFEDSWNDAISRDEGLPSGRDAAGWLFDRLAHHGWPHNHHASDLVVGELHIPILHAAVLRALRMCGKPELIEAQIPNAYNLWFLLKCLKERAVAGDFEASLVNRLRDITATSPWAQSPLVANLFGNMPKWTPVQQTEREASLRAAWESPWESPVTNATPVRYEDAVRALTDASFPLNPKPPLFLSELTAEKCNHLANLLDPSSDYRHVIRTSEPAVRFTRGGYVIGAAHVDQVDNRRELRAALRPAVAAANGFGLAIPWHRELLLEDSYAQSFIDCLAAQGDCDRFYDALAHNEDLLIQYLEVNTRAGGIMRYVDARMIPFIRRYSGAGSDALLETLCGIARRIEAPEIDPALAALFYRWSQRFDPQSQAVQHTQNYALWRAFDNLSTHPRFTFIQNYETQLVTVLQANIRWIYKHGIVRVLERSPRAYVNIESMLFKTAAFEHYFEDEVDRLDDAADALFRQLLEDDATETAEAPEERGRATEQAKEKEPAAT